MKLDNRMVARHRETKKQMTSHRIFPCKTFIAPNQNYRKKHGTQIRKKKRKRIKRDKNVENFSSKALVIHKLKIRVARSRRFRCFWDRCTSF